VSVEFSPRSQSALAESADRGLRRNLLARSLALLFAVLIGALIGFVTLASLELITRVSDLWMPSLPTVAPSATWHYSLALGFALLVSALIAGQLLSALEGGRAQGPADLVHAAQYDRDLSARSSLLSTSLGVVSVAGGASVGILGPLAVLGGWLTGFFGRLWHNRVPRDVWLGAGAGAAVAAIFSAPLGAAIFAQEAISRRFSAYGFTPALACALGAYCVVEIGYGGESLVQLTEVPALDFDMALIALGIGVVSGLVMSLHITLCSAAPVLGKLSGLPIALRPLLPAALLFAVSPLLPHILGTGFSSIATAVSGEFSLELLLWLVVAKLFLTCLCIGFGFFGDEIIPALFIGTMLGAATAMALGESDHIAVFALLGAAASLASVTGAPMAAIVIMLEMSGHYTWGALAAISVLVASQISRTLAGRSSFDRQLELRGILVNDDYRPRSTWIR
jgi:CIC family chloride channel protein